MVIPSIKFLFPLFRQASRKTDKNDKRDFQINSISSTPGIDSEHDCLNISDILLIGEVLSRKPRD